MAGNVMQFSLGLATGGFLAPLGLVKNALGSFAGAAMAMGGLAGGAGLGGSFIALAAAGIKFNATLEQQAMAFQTLLGSATQAQARIKELTQFAAQTPFELPEVVNANRLLQSLTGGALATKEGMRLVGDAAAAAGRDFSETAMWAGRLYAGLQSGTPVGEASSRLLEMGLISGETQRRLNKLAESGGGVGKGMDLMRSTFAKTSGAMELQSRTFNGLFSTLKDGIMQFSGAATKDIFAGLKGQLEALVALDWEGAGKRVGSVFAGLGQAVKDARLGEVLQLSLTAGLETFQNIFVSTIAATGGLIADILGNKQLWAGFGETALVTLASLGAGILDWVGPFTAGLYAKVKAGVEEATSPRANESGSWAPQPVNEKSRQAREDKIYEQEITGFLNRQRERREAIAAMAPGASADLAAGMREAMAATMARIRSIGGGESEAGRQLAELMNGLAAKAAKQSTVAAGAASTGSQNALAAGKIGKNTEVTALEKIGAIFFGGGRVDYAGDTARNTLATVRALQQTNRLLAAGQRGTLNLVNA